MSGYNDIAKPTSVQQKAINEYDKLLLAAFTENGWTQRAYNQLCSAGFRMPKGIPSLREFILNSDNFFTRGDDQTVYLISKRIVRTPSGKLFFMALFALVAVCM